MKFADRAWPAIRDIAASSRAVAILPCGATEAHGPHLPLGTDVIISVGVARRAAQTLEQSGIAALVLPSIAYAPADCAAEFAGTITIGPLAAKAVLADIARSLKMQGFSCLGIANSHFDPANVAMLRDVVADIRGMGLAVAFPDFTRRALAQSLTPEFLSGACHAGRFETSLVLADRPDLVNEAVRCALPENPASLTEAFSRGARTFAEAGGADAYFGDPRLATAEEGERTFRIMADALAAAVREAIAF
ncbi:MAG: creatininase family protein [Rhizomicrobium sp.]